MFDFLTAVLLGMLITVVLISLLFSSAVSHLINKWKKGNTALRNPTPLVAINPANLFLKKLDHLHTERVEHLLSEISDLGQETEKYVGKYELLVENIAAAIVVKDNSGRIIFCSPYTEVLTGYDREDIYSSEGDFFLQIAHPDDRQRYQRAQGVASVGEPFQFRFRIFHKSSMEIWVESRTVPIIDEHGELVSSLSITFDVTTSLRYQRQVEEKNRDLQDFAYMISHDLKAPLFSIKGLAKVLYEDLPDKEQTKSNETYDLLLQSVNRLESLISSVVEYSRLTSKTVESKEIELSSFFAELIEEHSQQLKEVGARVTTELQETFVIGDQLRLYQVFTNLLINSIKYRRQDVPLQLEIKSEPVSQKRSVEITFTDNGTGISEELHEKVFRPFQRGVSGSQAPAGTGIGLACAKKLLTQIGGAISLTSSPNQGATFRVVLRKA